MGGEQQQGGVDGGVRGSGEGGAEELVAGGVRADAGGVVFQASADGLVLVEEPGAHGAGADVEGGGASGGEVHQDVAGAAVADGVPVGAVGCLGGAGGGPGPGQDGEEQQGQQQRVEGGQDASGGGDAEDRAGEGDEGFEDLVGVLGCAVGGFCVVAPGGVVVGGEGTRVAASR